MENRTHYRPTKAIVDLEAIRNNVKFEELLGKWNVQIIAVVKADGYGHGEVEVAEQLLKPARKWFQLQRRMKRCGSEWRD